MLMEENIGNEEIKILGKEISYFKEFLLYAWRLFE